MNFDVDLPVAGAAALSEQLEDTGSSMAVVDPRPP